MSRGGGEVEPKRFGSHGLTVELPLLVDSLCFKHLIGQHHNGAVELPFFQNNQHGIAHAD